MDFKEWLKLLEVGGAGPGGTEPVQPAVGFAAKGAMPHFDGSGDTLPPDERERKKRKRKPNRVKFTKF